MSRTGQIVFAVLIFAFAWIFCTAVFSGGEGSSLVWVIGFVVALALGVGSYFGLGALQRRTVAQQEKTAREILTPHLSQGETLQAFVLGYTGPGRTGMILLFGGLGDAIINAPRRKWYYLGVTERHLAVVQVVGKKPTGVKQILSRGDVQSLNFDSGAFKEPKVILQLPAERMELRVDFNWRRRAKEVDAAWNGTMPA